MDNCKKSFPAFINIKLLIILFQINAIYFANTYDKYNSEYIYIEDNNYSKKSVSHLNVMIIVTNKSGIEIKKETDDPENILSELVFRKKYFINFKENINIEMEKIYPKEKIKNYIVKYINGEIHNKNNRIIRNVLSDLDIIFYLTIRQTQLEIQLINIVGEKIGFYKETMKNRMLLEKNIENVFMGLMDKYFFRSIIVPKTNNLIGEIYINNRLRFKKWEGLEPIELKNIFRYNDFTVHIVTNDSVSNNIAYKGEIFSLNKKIERRIKKGIK